MAGLNDLVTDVKTETTSLPSWYDQAQQRTVAKAITADSPAIADTAAQTAVDVFADDDTSPFKTGQSILTSIGEGAANPWLVSEDQQTVTPNVNTALGGLYKAQQDYLKEIMPDLDATSAAGAISGGGFGSRMNLSALANARANAAADLFQKQMQSALQAQQTGVSAGAALGNIANQEVQSALNTGTYQQNAPYASALNLANIISKLQVPTTVTKSEQLGGLNQIIGLLNLTDGGLSSILGGVKKVGGKDVQTPGIVEQIKGFFTKKPSGAPGGISYPSAGEIFNPAQPGQEGYGWKYFEDGTVIDPSGQQYFDGQLVWSPAWESDFSGGSDDLSGGNADWLDEYDWDALARGDDPYDYDED